MIMHTQKQWAGWQRTGVALRVLALQACVVWQPEPLPVPKRLHTHCLWHYVLKACASLCIFIIFSKRRRTVLAFWILLPASPARAEHHRYICRTHLLACCSW
jgi:hypothetical protein